MRPPARSTTILTVRRGGRVAIGGDGQVTMASTVMKRSARKVRRLHGGRVLAGMTGAAADSFSLLERLDGFLEKHQGNLLRSAADLAREWRLDRALRRLEALIAVVDADRSLLISGTGDVIEPDDGVIGVGSGGPYALAAARALLAHTSMSAREVVEEALRITSEICIYTNSELVIDEMESRSEPSP